MNSNGQAAVEMFDFQKSRELLLRSSNGFTTSYKKSKQARKRFFRYSILKIKQSDWLRTFEGPGFFWISGFHEYVPIISL